VCAARAMSDIYESASSMFTGVAIDQDAQALYVSDYCQDCVWRIDLLTSAAAPFASLRLPTALLLLPPRFRTPSRYLLVTTHRSISAVSSTGAVARLEEPIEVVNVPNAAAHFRNFSSLDIDSVGRVFVTDSGPHQLCVLTLDAKEARADRGNPPALSAPGMLSSIPKPNIVVVSAARDEFFIKDFDGSIHRLNPDMARSTCLVRPAGGSENFRGAMACDSATNVLYFSVGAAAVKMWCADDAIGSLPQTAISEWRGCAASEERVEGWIRGMAIERSMSRTLARGCLLTEIRLRSAISTWPAGLAELVAEYSPWTPPAVALVVVNNTRVMRLPLGGTSAQSQNERPKGPTCTEIWEK
jgi:hypothetical protein